MILARRVCIERYLYTLAHLDVTASTIMDNYIHPLAQDMAYDHRTRQGKPITVPQHLVNDTIYMYYAGI